MIFIMFRLRKSRSVFVFWLAHGSNCFVVILWLFCSAFLAGSAWAQNSILDAPASRTPTNRPGIYPTAESLFAATRNGTVVEMLRHYDYSSQNNLANSVYHILQREYGLKADRIHGSDTQNSLGYILAALTNYEFETDKKREVQIAKDNENQAFGTPGDQYNPTFEDSRAIFRRFAGQYTQVVKQYVATKENQDEQHQIELAAAQHQTEVTEKQAAEEKRRHKEMTEARQASQKAEEDIKAQAMASALDNAKNARKQKLAEILESPFYKQWEAALQVQQGEELISKGQASLDHDDQVRRESGVTDLAARRAAGEQLVAGKSLVESSFDTYKKLGGKAATPDKVVPGPDPAADYR